MSESAIFKAAVKLAPERRAAYLEQTCGAKPDLRREVESLLRAHDASGSFLQEPPARPQATVDGPPITAGPGTVIGPYKLLQQIGEGGMGVVYMAEQQEPVRRKVALKVIKPGMDSRQVIARFEAERQALAMMDHQNIAKVLDAGTTDTGRPYFVMELVHGIALTKYCDDNQLTPRQRLELFVPICQAIQHAHQKGIIHRDVKPSNVLVTMYDDKPVPKVIDFGVAKAVDQRLTEKTLFTQYGTLVGTFEYMSPEQAEMNAFGVDTRSDVYSLGVLLYELLTGSTPLERLRLGAAAYGEIVRLIKEEEPPRPSTRLSNSGAALAGISQQRGSEPDKLTRLVRGELDWIVMRCLEKDRTRRYETANGLARDVERYLKDEPVEACPPTNGYKLRKFARKNQKLLATAVAFAALLLLGVAASGWQAVRAMEAGAAANGNAVQAQEKEREANQQRDEAQRQRDEVKGLNDKLRETQAQLQRTLYAAHMNLAQHAWEAGGVERVRDLLEHHRPKTGESDLRGFEWRYLDRLCHAEILTLNAHQFQFNSVAFSPDGKRLATASLRLGGKPPFNAVKLWDAKTGEELLTLNTDSPMITCVTFSPDGKRLASAGGDGKVWDLRTGKELVSFKGGGGTIAFSPDGKRLATTAYTRGDTGPAKVWNAQTGEEILTIKSAFNCVAFSPDGNSLATASDANTVKVWDAKTGKELLTFKGHTGSVLSVAFSPDGNILAAASDDGTVKVWDTQTGKQLVSIQNGGRIVAFSPDSKRLACGGAGSGADYNTVRVREAKSGLELFALRGQTFGVHSLAFSADGNQLAVAGYHAVKVWDVQSANPLILKSGSAFLTAVALSPDGKRLASSSANRTITVWDALTGQEVVTLKGHTSAVTGLAFSPDGKLLASGSRDQPNVGGEVKVWDAQTGKELLSLPFDGVMNPGTVGATVAFSPDGKLLASTGGGVRVFDVQTGKELLVLDRSRYGKVAFSPDGKRLAYANISGWTRVWDVQTGKELLSVKDGGRSVAFSPDGKRLATPSDDNTIKVWDAQTGKELLALKGHTETVWSVVFSPDGKRLVSAAGKVKLWDAQTGQELLTLKDGGGSVAFSSDGHRVASITTDGTVMIWDATPVPAKP